MNMGRIEDKKKEIMLYLEELDQVAPAGLTEYLESLEKRLACERSFEKIIEAVNDLAILFIREKELIFPEEDVKAFEILASNKFISNELAEKLKLARGMRNFLVHQYDKIDDEVVFEAISENISQDVEEFLESLK